MYSIIGMSVLIPVACTTGVIEPSKLLFFFSHANSQTPAKRETGARDRKKKIKLFAIEFFLAIKRSIPKSKLRKPGERLNCQLPFQYQSKGDNEVFYTCERLKSNIYDSNCKLLFNNIFPNGHISEIRPQTKPHKFLA